jgi:hypothetical protein
MSFEYPTRSVFESYSACSIDLQFRRRRPPSDLIPLLIVLILVSQDPFMMNRLCLFWDIVVVHIHRCGRFLVLADGRSYFTSH